MTAGREVRAGERWRSRGGRVVVVVTAADRVRVYGVDERSGASLWWRRGGFLTNFVRDDEERGQTSAEGP